MHAPRFEAPKAYSEGDSRSSYHPRAIDPTRAPGASSLLLPNANPFGLAGLHDGASAEGVSFSAAKTLRCSLLQHGAGNVSEAYLASVARFIVRCGTRVKHLMCQRMLGAVAVKPDAPQPVFTRPVPVALPVAATPVAPPAPFNTFQQNTSAGAHLASAATGLMTQGAGLAVHGQNGSVGGGFPALAGGQNPALAAYNFQQMGMAQHQAQQTAGGMSQFAGSGGATAATAAAGGAATAAVAALLSGLAAGNGQSAGLPNGSLGQQQQALLQHQQNFQRQQQLQQQQIQQQQKQQQQGGSSGTGIGLVGSSVIDLTSSLSTPMHLQIPATTPPLPLQHQQQLKQQTAAIGGNHAGVMMRDCGRCSNTLLRK